MRFGLKLTSVDIPAEDIKRLQQLRKERVLLLPNHGNAIEPFVVLHLSKLLGLDFAYLGAKEVFLRHPIAAWFLQRLGGYSIVRGTFDKASFRMTQQLLVDGKHWVVIFPEGEVRWLSADILPFQEGVIQLAFSASAEIDKRGGPKPLYIVPVAIQFSYLREMKVEIEGSLKRLENKLFPHESATVEAPYARLRRIGEAVLQANERRYAIRAVPGASLDERMQHMKMVIVERAEGALGLPSDRNLPMLARIRDLLNRVERSLIIEPEESEYDQELRQEIGHQATSLYESLSRVLRFIAIHDEYINQQPSTERFLDVLRLLELELTGRRQFWGPRKASVRVGKPLEIEEYRAAYKLNKAEVLRNITTELEAQERKQIATLQA